jgi:hypothetical protein
MQKEGTEENVQTFKKYPSRDTVPLGTKLQFSSSRKE